MPLAAGTRVGPYEILAAIGAGGMGEVWRARDSRLERDVALKVLPAAALGDETARARLVREARLASKLNHPHICTIYEVGETDGQAHIAMELVEGQPLSARLLGGALPVDQVLRFGEQLAAALAHAHARGVIHRDFKSANVVVTPEGQVKVLDFGLAKRLAGDATADETTMSRQSLTKAGMVAGTLAYMAPEQLRGQPADARSDIWALGVVLFELVAGQRPFQGRTGFELSSAILNQPVPAAPASVPAPLAGVIERCLAKEPGARYQQAGEVRAALEAGAAGQAVAPPSPVRGKRILARGLVVAVGGIVLVAIVAALVFALDVGGLRSRLVGPAGTPARVLTLAVLPFENASGNPEQEYFSDAQTQEMMTALGRLRPETLLVKARASVMRYKKTDKPIDQIGRELGVEYVLEGSAQVVGGRAQIFAELVKVADQTQLWGQRYDRELAGILVLQNDVAQQVAKKLALKVLPEEQARLTNVKSVDPEVYELCLRGSYHTQRLTKADLDTAERYYQLALARDPGSALAHAGMSSVWRCRQQMGFASPAVAGPKARAATLRAIELDDTLALAHAALAGMHAWTDFDFPSAERESRRAIELDPSDANLRAGRSHYLMILRRPVEAMQEIERAVALDPLSTINLSFYAIDLYCVRRYDEAIAQARTVLRMQSDAGVAMTALLFSLHEQKRYDEAVDLAASAYAGPLFGWPDIAEAVRKSYAEAGYAAAFRRASDLETAKYRDQPGVAMDAAINYVMAADYPRALAWLEKAYVQRDPNLPYANCMPLYDPLRGEPRFQALLRKMNLPQ